MFKSTALRITLTYFAAFAIATAVLGIAVYFIARHALERQVDDRISAEASFLVSEYRGEGEASLREVIRNREVAIATNDLGYGLFAADGRHIAGSLETQRPPLGWQTLQFHDPRDRQVLDAARALAIDIRPNLRLVVAADRDALDDAEDLILLTLAVTLLVMVVLGAIGAAALAAHLRGRLAVIATSAEVIIHGDLTQRIPVGPSNDPFDRLAVLLNMMLDRIAMLLDNLQQVSSDIAHDLRRPLTRLRHHLERGLEDGAPIEAIEGAIAQTDEVLALFGSILRLSEIESGGLRAAFQPIDLSDLAADIGESYRPAAEDGGRFLDTRIGRTAAIEGYRDLLAQALINLLDNALLHTPVGTRIVLTVAACPEGVALTVADDGPGVPHGDRYRVLQRFTRLEASRYLPGHGLGLSLVAAIARIHKARLTIGSAAPGFKITLTFPYHSHAARFEGTCQ